MQLTRRAPRRLWQRYYSNAPQATSSEGNLRHGPPSFLNLRNGAWRAVEKTLGDHGLTGSPSRKQWASTVISFISQRPATPGPAPQRQHSRVPATDKFVGELASLLIGARHFCRFDVLSYLGISQGRWDAVSWIIKALSERPIHRRLEDLLLQNGPFGMRSASLRPSDDLASRISFDLQPPKCTDTSRLPPHWKMRRRGITGQLQMAGLGQVWRSLGNFVLLASSSKDTVVSQDIMDQALGALAILHHNGIMPHHTYTFESPAPSYPFVIERLSHIMMMAILDSEWNLNQSDSPEAAKYMSQAQFAIPGVEFSDLHNPERILPYAHSIWLELILWSCLKGGWVADGMDILHRVIQQHHGQDWSIVASVQSDAPRLIHVLETSLSEELMLAYSRAVANTLPPDLHEAAQCLDSSAVVDYLHQLKTYLGTQNIRLDNRVLLGISTRMTVSGERDSQANQSALLDASRLLSEDVGSKRLSNTLLGAYHQLLRPSLAAGSCDMVIRTVEEMRKVLRKRPSNQPVLPPTTLANLLDFICHVDPHVYGHEILFGRYETDLALIPDNLESVTETLPALLRYATKTGDAELLHRITLALSKLRPGSKISVQMMIAVAETQIEDCRWDAVEELITSPRDRARGAEQSQGVCIIIASLAKACLLLQRECLDGAAGAASSFERATMLLRIAALHHAPGDPPPSRLPRVHALLGMLASVGPAWAALVKPLLQRRHGARPLEAPGGEFALLLEGVVGALPLCEVAAFWQRWCLPLPPAGRLAAGDEEHGALVRGVAPAPATGHGVEVTLDDEGGVLTYVGGVAPDWRAVLALYRCVEARKDADEESRRFLLDLVKGFYGGEAGMLREVGHIGPAMRSRGDYLSGGITEDVDRVGAGT